MIDKRRYININGEIICFIFIGESNSGGFADNSECTALELLPNQFVKHLNNDTLKLETLKISGNDANNQLGHCGIIEYNGVWHGWEKELGNYARRNELRFDFYTCKNGQGGSKVAEWLGEDPYVDDDCTVYPFELFQERFTVFKSQLPTNKPIRYVVLASLGINDLIAGTTAATYETKLKQILLNVRAEVDEEKLPIFFTGFNQVLSGIDDYNTAIQNVATDIGNMHVVDMTGADLNIDGIHWADAGETQFVDGVIIDYKSNYL